MLESTEWNAEKKAASLCDDDEKPFERVERAEGPRN